MIFNTFLKVRADAYEAMKEAYLYEVAVRAFINTIKKIPLDRLKEVITIENQGTEFIEYSPKDIDEMLRIKLSFDSKYLIE